MVHTPHRDKKRGTSRSMDVCIEHGIDPSRVVIDHNNEETIDEVLDRGFWAAFSIYPSTKMGSVRMVELLKKYGGDGIILDSATDWGISDPLAVPKTAALARERGVAEEAIRKATYGNALTAYGTSGQIAEADWIGGVSVDQSQLHEGNSLLRGGMAPRIGRSDDNIIE